MGELKDVADAEIAAAHDAIVYIGTLVTQLAAANAAGDTAERDAVIAELKQATADLKTAATPVVAAGAGSSASTSAP